MIWIAFGFLGLLVGSIAGLSASSISNALLAAIFTFVGGSIIVMQNKLTEEQIRFSMKIITAFSIATLIGIYSAIAIGEYQILTPKNERNKNVQKYLRSNIGPFFQKLEDEVSVERKTYKEAFNELKQYIKETE